MMLAPVDQEPRRAVLDVQQTLKLFGDGLRLRMLALIDGQELTVGELAAALGAKQSRVSNHLRLLREAGLLDERREGTSVWVRAGSAGAGATCHRLWRELAGELRAESAHAADQARLARVLARRGSGDFFDRVAPSWDKLAGAFGTGQARLRAAARLLPAGFSVADLGCGTGTMSEPLLGIAARLVCVDRSRGMLAQAKRRLSPRARSTQLEFRRGPLDRLPLADGEVQGALLGMVLHHVERPAEVVAEACRALAPGGTLAVLELAPHREEWMQAELGDRRLGLDPAEVARLLERAGFGDVQCELVEDRYRPRRPGGAHADLELYVVSGRKTASAAHPALPRRPPARRHSPLH
jgi:ArsR family transcriptional regulator